MKAPLKPRFDIQAIKDRYRLSDLIGQVVKLTRQGREFSGLCPFHSEKSPSFTVNDQKGFYHCFGCGAHGDVIAWTEWAQKCSTGEALSMLARGVGLEASTRVEVAQARCTGPDPETAMKTSMALYLWRQAVPIAGTPAETYLRGRGLELELPPTLRFHPRCPRRLQRDGADRLVGFAPGSEAPAMLAGIQRVDGKLVGLHRTFIKPDGSGKAEGQIKAKLMLGPAMGNAVRLSEMRPTLYVAEGIETALTILQAKPGAAVWAGLSLHGMGGLNLPHAVEEVVLCADNDIKNPEKQAMAQAAKLMKRHEVRVRICLPPRGMDFNDWLMGDADG